MSKPTVEAGQLWEFRDHLNRTSIFLVTEPFENHPDGWQLFSLGGYHTGPVAWERGTTMLTNKKWRFLS